MFELRKNISSSGVPDLNYKKTFGAKPKITCTVIGLLGSRDAEGSVQGFDVNRICWDTLQRQIGGLSHRPLTGTPTSTPSSPLITSCNPWMMRKTKPRNRIILNLAVAKVFHLYPIFPTHFWATCRRSHRAWALHSALSLGSAGSVF